MSDRVDFVVKVFKGPEETSVLEFHQTYGFLFDFSQKTKDFRIELEDLEATLHGEKKKAEDSEGDEEEDEN